MSGESLWSLAADVATVGATAIAGIGLIWNALSLRASTRSSDLNSLFQMTGQIESAESRMVASKDDPLREDADFNNYVNMLETLAAAINGRLFGKVPRRIASDRLCNDIAILMAHDWSRDRIGQAVTSHETFREIATFHRRHKKRILAHAAAIKDASSSLQFAA